MEFKNIRYCIGTLLALVVSISNAQLNTFSDTWEQRSYTSPYFFDSVIAPNDVGDVVVTVDASSKTAKVLPTHFANNIGHWVGNNILTDGVRLPLLRTSNTNYLRFPGGNTSNRYFWDGNVPDSTLPDPIIDDGGVVNGEDSWRLKPDDYLHLCDSMNSVPVVCVNLSYARYGVPSTRIEDAAHYAANFVRYMNDTLNGNVQYWEIGNENYGKWQAGYEVNGVKITGSIYGDLFNVFADSMRAADSTIKLGAVIRNRDGQSNDWTKLVLEKVENSADFLISHEYFISKPNENDVTYAEMMSMVKEISEDRVNIQNMVSSYTSKNFDHFPIAMTEFNSNSGNRETAMANSIFVSQVIMEQIKNRFGMSMLWDIQDGTDADGGDHGFLSNNDPDVPNFTARPNFYLYHYLPKFVGGDLISTSTNDTTVQVYGSIFQGGELGFIVVNTTGFSKTIQLDISNSSSKTHLFWYEMRADDEADYKIYINEKTTTLSEGGPTNYTNISPYGRRVDGNFKIEAKPFSINFVAYADSQYVGGISNVSSNHLRVWPNPSNSVFEVTSTSAAKEISVADAFGRELKNQRINNQNQFQIDLSEFPTGTYFLKVVHQYGIEYRKLIKSN